MIIAIEFPLNYNLGEGGKIMIWEDGGEWGQLY